MRIILRSYDLDQKIHNDVEKDYDKLVSEALGMCSSELLKGKNYINNNISAFYIFKIGFQYTPQTGFTLLLPQLL